MSVGRGNLHGLSVDNGTRRLDFRITFQPGNPPENFAPEAGFWRKAGTMTSQTIGKARIIATWILRVFVGLAFLGISIEKLTGTMGTVPFFEAIGWGQWFRYVTGAMDTAGAMLIFIPCWTSLGSFIITCTVGLGTVLCFTTGLFNPIFPLTITLLAATLVWLAWRPRSA